MFEPPHKYCTYFFFIIIKVANSEILIYESPFFVRHHVSSRKESCEVHIIYYFKINKKFLTEKKKLTLNQRCGNKRKVRLKMIAKMK